MARYAYDVNTTQRYIDVHKQFQGGLKTVDTDDALGAVFLREAENISLSEFGFLEKRYGTFENFKTALNGILQGYWEFGGFGIYAVDGRFYYSDGTTQTPVSTILQENSDFRYPTLPQYDNSTGFAPVNNVYRDMNAVNINNVLYIFTGYYPVYVKIVSNAPVFYWFSVNIPTYDEIVVTGHNLLEDNYEDAYEFEGSNATLQNSQGVVDNAFYIKKSNWFPQFPYVEEFENEDPNANKLNVEFSFNRDATVSVDASDPYYEVFVDSVSYAPAGSTASDVFTKVDPEYITQNVINTNKTGSAIESNGFRIYFWDKVIVDENANSKTIRQTSVFRKGQEYRILFTGGGTTTPSTVELNIVFIDNQLVTLENVSLTKKGDYYFFTIPNDYFVGEEATLTVQVFAIGTPVIDTVWMQPTYYLQPTENDLSQDLIQVGISNLLSGNWDFRFKLQFREIYTYKREVLFETEFVVSDVTITPEKLQDRPGDEGVPIEPHPIWTCNKVIEHFGKLMVWGSTQMPTALFYSFPDRPTYFPSKFYLDFANDYNKPVEAVTNYLNVLIVQTEDATWGVKGNSGLLDAPAPYTPFTVNPTVGTIAYKSVRPVRNKLFFLSKQGVVSLNSLYAVDEMYNIKFEDLNIRNIVPQDTKAVGIQYDNQYWLNFPNFGITLRWYIDKNAWVLDKFGAWNQFKGIFKWQIANGKLEFITYPSRFAEGENLSVYKVGVDYSLPTDLTGLITTKVETSFLNQNYPFHPKNYKEAKLDFTLQNEYNVSKETLYNEEDITITGGLHYLNNVSLVKNHRYYIYFYDMPETTGATITIYPTLQSEDGGYQPFYSTSVTPTDNYLEFIVPNSIADGIYDVKVQFTEGITVGPLDLDLRDATYDNVLTFLTWIISEENTLNQDPIQDYDQAKAEIDFSLQDKFGDWEFGETNFGKTTTAVKTIKLSGRGYNVKLYMEDFSKSKWTLESLGITYKMKRARSR